MALHQLVQRILLIGSHRYTAPAPKIGPPPAALAPLIASLAGSHATYNARAIRYGHRYRSGYWMIYLLSAVAAAVKAAPDAAGRIGAQKRLALLLTGHSIAEEAVIYPALVAANEEAHSTKAYTEQSAAKVQMGLLENLDPMSQEYLDKLEHIRGAVAHHVYEEEGNWFLDLKTKLPPADQMKITFRYQEEFSRYTRDSEDETSDGLPSPMSRLSDGVTGAKAQY